MHTVLPMPAHAFLDLMCGSRILRGTDGWLYLCFGELHYRAEDCLSPLVRKLSPHYSRTARQFAAQCLLRRYGPRPEAWPDLARKFAEIH